MTCTEFEEHIATAVDGRLDAGTLLLFLEHARLCPPCRQSYESERSVVSLVRARIHRAQTPAGVVSRIIARIAYEETVGVPSRSRSIDSPWQAPLTKPAMAFIISSIAIVFLVSRSGSDRPIVAPYEIPGKEIIGQSTANYRAVMRGEIVPQVVSDIPDRVRSFFEGKTEFPVIIPVMKECLLIGGVVNEYQGARLAHVVYKHGVQTIYLYQACRETVMRGGTLDLALEARRDIERTGWYCGTTIDGDAIVVWAKGATICAAIAPMKSDHLMAHLAEAEHSNPW